MTEIDAGHTHDQVAILVRDALASAGIVNVPVVAERLLLDCQHSKISLAEAEALVLKAARLYTFPIEFDGKRRQADAAATTG